MKSLLDASFKYVPAAATDIKETWRKFGWRPTNELPNMRPVVNSKSDKNKKRNNQTIQDVRQ
jgi:hypothetical protein